MAIKLGDALVHLGTNNKGLERGLGDAKREVTSWTTAITQGIGMSLGQGLANAAAQGIRAIGGLTSSVLSFSADGRQAVLDFEAELGATTEEAKILAAVSKRVWADNYGRDVADAAAAVGLVRQQMRGLGSDGIQYASQTALALRDTYGGDLPKLISSARTLTEDFGLSNVEAWDFIAKGYQEGLDRSGDFLDSIGEYAPQFRSAGAGAAEFFSAMDSGLQGGMLGTDKALDMFKEFRVRIVDGSTATADGLSQIGLSAQDVTAAINDGSLSWSDAFTMVQGRIRDTGSESIQLQAGVALMGAQFEDMGTQAALGVNLAQTNLEDLAGSVDQLGVKYTSLQSLSTGMGRRLVMALSPATDAILQMANEAMPGLEAGFKRIEAGAGSFAVGFVAIFKSMIEVARAFFKAFRGDAGTQMDATAGDASDWGANIVISLARGMAAAGIYIVQVINSIGAILSDWLKPGSPPKVAPQIDKWGEGMIDAWIGGALGADISALAGLGGKVQAILGGVGSSVALGTFSAITGQISSLFNSLPGTSDDESIVARIMGSREAIAAAVAEIDKLGQVSTGTYTAVMDALSPLPAEARAYAAAMLEVQAADRQVAAAQAEVNNLSAEYDQRLKAQRGELDALNKAKADTADDKRIAALRQAIARGALNEEQKGLALMEIRERELKKQIRSTEAEKTAAMDGATVKLTAAQARQAAADEEARIQAELIKSGEEHNALINRQISLLDKMAGAMAGIGDALGAALSGAGAGLDSDLLGGGGLDLGLDGIGDGLAEELETAMGELDIETIMADVAAEFTPLEEAVTTLGDTFGTLGENWDGFLARFGLADTSGQATVDWLGTLLDLLTVIAGVLLGIKAAGLILWLAGAIGSVATAAAGASGVMGTLSAVVAALGGPVTLLAALLGGIAAAWATDFMGMRTTITGLWSLIVIIFTLIWAKIVAWDQETSAIFEEWGRKVSAKFDEVKEWARQLAERIGFQKDQIIKAFKDMVTKIKEKLDLIKGYFESVKSWVASMRLKFEEEIGKAVEQWSKFYDKVWNLHEAFKGLWEWLKGKVFQFKINLPDLPDWAIPGSPIPLHTAWAAFADDMNNTTIAPKFEPTGAGIPGEGPAAAVSPSPASGPIFTGDIILGDSGAVAAFMEWLQGSSDDRDLQGEVLLFEGL